MRTLQLIPPLLRLTDKETTKKVKRMKKNILAIAMLLALGATLPATAQTTPKQEQQELVDSTRQDSMEAFSDTTDTVDDSTVVSASHRMGGYSVGSDSVIDGVFSNLGVEGLAGMTFVLVILLIIFVISPLTILGVILYFVFRNRKQKIQLAETAVKQGQPIPDQLLVENGAQSDDLWQRGIRQTFLGIGLMIFLGYVAGEIGFAIGALVACIGIGKLVIVKTTKKD